MVEKIRRFIFGKFVKTCRELNHWLEMRPRRYAQYHPDKPGKLGLRPCDCKWKGLRSFRLIKTLVSGDYQKWSDSSDNFFLLFWCHCLPLCVTYTQPSYFELKSCNVWGLLFFTLLQIVCWAQFFVHNRYNQVGSKKLLR